MATDRTEDVADLQHVEVRTLDPERFREHLDPEEVERVYAAIDRGRELFAGRRLWNVNSTAQGGGVAEMLRSLLGYVRGIGIDARWEVLRGNPEFFKVTKRIHNNLHGAEGDGGRLGDAERRVYESALQANAEALKREVDRRDVVLLHDPQTAGLVPMIHEIGASVVWRCHVGLDMPNDRARTAWAFLEPYVNAADALIFSREAFEWEGLDRAKVHVIPPSIDAFSPKNYELDDATVREILVAAAIVVDGEQGAPSFHRRDESPGRIDRPAQIVGDVGIPMEAPLVVQVSRWDRLKDPVGVLEAFVDRVAPDHEDAHLAIAGPEVAAVSDDPEGQEVLAEATRRWEALPDDMRRRVHLVCLPMHDEEVNAVMVNALQRRAHVIVQKSLAEGFGLTVAEGMWKARPVVASRIGGIQDQIEDGRTGILLKDPTDHEEFGAAVGGLLDDPERAGEIGRLAHERVRHEFLGPQHLMRYLELMSGWR